MTPQQTRRILTLSAATASLTAVCVLAWALGSRPQVSVPNLIPSDLAASALTDPQAPVDGTRGPTLAQLQGLEALPLRQPLRDPPPSPAPDASVPLPLAAKLIGAVIEADQSMAMFQLPDGSVQFYRAGQTFDDPAGSVTVTQIQPQTVTVEYHQNTHDLEVPR